MIEVLIVDDERLLRESLRKILENDDEIHVSGCAGNGEEAYEACCRTVPNIVLMDLKMPVCDGIEGTRQIKNNFPLTKVIILTTFEENAGIRNALQAGADGYILKDIVPEDMIMVIKNTSKGYHIMSERTYSAISDSSNGSCAIRGRETPKILVPVLNETEQRILQLVAEGQSNKEIATAIFLSEGRVKNIISEMFMKLELRDRYQMISYAYKNNLIK